MKKISSKQLVSRLLKWVDKFNGVPVLVVGDLMIDRSFKGPAERISPEAPVPVVHVHEETFVPGGAGNVVHNLVVLGCRPTLVSLRGDDSDGQRIERQLEKLGVRVTNSLITDPSRPTITKNRLFAGHTQVARYDFERRGHVSAEIIAALCQRLEKLIPQHKSVLISDYGKAVVTPEIIKASCKQAQKAAIPLIVDPKIEHFFQYKGVDCITPNTKEAVEGMRALPPKSEKDLLALGERILKKLKSRSLLVTRGEKGMTLFRQGAAPQTIPALAQEVYDVTGAGDTVVATFSAARAVGADYFEAAFLANLAASIVVAKVGTAVATRTELIQRIQRLS